MAVIDSSHLPSIPDVGSSGLDPVHVAGKDGVHRVLATEPIDPDTKILEIRGVLVDHPSRFSLQIGEDLHLEVPSIDDLDPAPDNHPWRYLNHSCEPNAVLKGRSLVALKAIAPGEEVTFDYNTTEYEMSAPFACHCGHCDGVIVRGFKYLSMRRRRKIQWRLADHLRRKMDPHEAR